MTGIIELLKGTRDEQDGAAGAARPASAAPFDPEPRTRREAAPARNRASTPASAAVPQPFASEVPSGMGAEVAQLFARLHPLLDDRGALVLHVAAAQAGEGTSTIARTLAAHAASLRRYRTLLIDAAAAPGRSRADGAGRSLAGARNSGGDLGAVLAPSGSEWLYSATLAGADCRSEPSVAEIGEIYEQLRDSWPVIVVDGPPILERAEMVNIARKSDGVLLVVRAAQPQHEQLVRARDLIEGSGARVLGVVLNRYQSHIPRFIERRM